MLGFRDDDDYNRAREVLQHAGYTEAAISSLLGQEQILSMPPNTVPQVLRRTRGLSRLDTLIRLFYLGVPTPSRAVAAALAPMAIDSWVEAGLLHPPDGYGQTDPRVQLWPLSGLFLAIDLPWRQPAAPGPDFVVSPGLLTMELARAMVRRPCRRVLDLGTGSGMLALLAASCAQSVVATDRNERAVAFTRFNARLNGIANVFSLVGDLFEPLAEEQFQLVVCNPPFVISPTQRFLFRDSGERGDLFCRRLARSAVAHLEIGGFFQFTANVAHETGTSWRSNLEAWFEGLDCDVLVLVERTEAASDYAMSWIVSTEAREPALISQRYEIWMDYLEREGIEGVSYVLVTLRRSAGGPRWVQIEDPPCRVVGPCGDELERFFRCRDVFGGATGTETLLNRRLLLSPQIRIEQEYVMTPGGLDLSRIRVKKTGGLQYPLGIHGNVARLLAGCDGSRTLRELLEELFDSLRVGWDGTLPVVLPAVISLLERSVLLAPEASLRALSIRINE